MDEFAQRFAGRFFGKYRGIVVRNDDPKNEGKIMAKVPVVLGQRVIGWCRAAQSEGDDENAGDFRVPTKNSNVWIEFEEGDTSRPIWTPGSWSIRDGVSTIPQHGRGIPDELDYAIRDHGNIPPSQFAGTYGNVRVIKNKGGSFIEFDDTPGAERVQMAHKVGSRIEIGSDGGYQEVSTAHARRRAEGDHDVEIGGNEKWFVGRNREYEIQGETVNTFGSNVTQHFKQVVNDGQSFTETWGGTYSVSSRGPRVIKSGSNGTESFAGQYALMAGKNVQLTALENFEISALNSLSLPPSLASIAMLLHAQNGNLVLKASETQLTPVTVLGNEIHLIGNAPPMTPSIKLGGDMAVQPMVLGTLYQTLFSLIFTILATHTHPHTFGVTGPSPEILAQVATWITQLQGTLSFSVMGS